MARCWQALLLRRSVDEDFFEFTGEQEELIRSSP